MRGWIPVVVALIAGASVIIGTLIVARTIEYVKTFNNSLLTVTGSTQQLITSDEVRWTGNFTVQTPATDLKGGYASIEKDRALVESFLRHQGVDASEVTISPVMMEPIYNNCGLAQKLGVAPGQAGCVNQIVSYRLVQNVDVESSHVHKITALAQDAGILINQGVVFSTQSLKYYYTHLAGLRVKLLAAATQDAQQRAQRIASSTGLKVGHLVSVNTGVIQITRPNSTQVSGLGVYDTSTIQKEITAVVRASFTVEQ